VTSIVVPAHNEERVLGRTLSALLADTSPSEFDVVVVANGCTDGTAEVARGFGGVRVVETDVPSKSHALRLGDETAAGFPRVYLDADVVLPAAHVRALCAALSCWPLARFAGFRWTASAGRSAGTTTCGGGCRWSAASSSAVGSSR
jgi:glycosyltransferase involved in cell wall biosynthesis